MTTVQYTPPSLPGDLRELTRDQEKAAISYLVTKPYLELELMISITEKQLRVLANARNFHYTRNLIIWRSLIIESQLEQRYILKRKRDLVNIIA